MNLYHGGLSCDAENMQAGVVLGDNEKAYGEVGPACIGGDQTKLSTGAVQAKHLGLYEEARRQQSIEMKCRKRNYASSAWRCLEFARLFVVIG